jgi:hypothetical protein
MRIATGLLLLAALTAVAPPGFSAAKELPKTTEDGLELKKQTKQRVVYARPGASFAQYKQFGLADCYIEFSKTWMEDYNRSVRELSRKISESDLVEVRKDLATQFRKIFSQVLTEGGYTVSETTGPDVLLLRPALVNIAVTAPDLKTPGRTDVYASSAGQMTLYLELRDSSTNTILGRVMDARSDSDFVGQRMSSVDNRAAADQLMRAWAEELRKKLDVAQGKLE